MNILQDAGMTPVFSPEATKVASYWEEAEMSLAQRAREPRSIEVFNISTNGKTTGIARIVFHDGIGYISGITGGTTVKEVSKVLDELGDELESILEAPPIEYADAYGHPIY